MIVEDKIKVHDDLCEIHKLATCRGNSCCCENKPELADNLCVNYVSCGPEHICKNPCSHCLSWEGYGGYETVQAIKNRYPLTARG